MATETTRTPSKLSNRAKKLIKPLSQPLKSSKTPKSSSNETFQPDEIISLYTIIPAEGTVLTYTKIRFSQGLQRRALVDTEACGNVISKQTFEDLKEEKMLFRPLEVNEPKPKRVRMAGGQQVSIETEVTLEIDWQA